MVLDARNEQRKSTVIRQYGWTHNDEEGVIQYIVTNPKDWKDGCIGLATEGFKSEVIGLNSHIPHYVVYITVVAT